MTYMIIQDTLPGKLVDTVNTMLKLGWRIVGGLSVVSTPSGTLKFFQAIVIED